MESPQLLERAILLQKSIHSVARNIAILKQTENEVPVSVPCGGYGMSNPGNQKWRSKNGGVALTGQKGRLESRASAVLRVGNTTQERRSPHDYALRPVNRSFAETSA